MVYLIDQQMTIPDGYANDLHGGWKLIRSGMVPSRKVSTKILLSCLSVMFISCLFI